MQVEVLHHAPEDLTFGRLVRLGEGIGKVAFASGRWVIKRERRPSEIISLICIWKLLRKLEHLLPGGLGRRMLENPGRQIRLVRVMFQAIVVTIPRSVWLATHVGEIWEWYTARESRGETLAHKHLTGTSLLPRRIIFPPTRVRVGGWPGWIVVSEAVERVETTLHDRINSLARAQRFDDIEIWLNRLLEHRQAGWKRGLFSLDAHLKNFGVIGDRLVLLDTGGLTDAWHEIDQKLGIGDELPHAMLGLEMTLRDRPDIAGRFDERWRATVNPEVVRSLWPR
jgi:hypothetical protein